ncbi:hypothetical protein DN752_18400 [Echinicola strongylocentroti]|uniref:Uncharacterized protein n=1 Tax=Echinicola strongylocentroti TaxID=1795355 RepID=A0A2Z4IMI3_9BACT|nr:hypothetical protein DN752_18400 [Echinicola strongylocentroti]
MFPLLVEGSMEHFSFITLSEKPYFILGVLCVLREIKSAGKKAYNQNIFQHQLIIIQMIGLFLHAQKYHLQNL